jgi:alpha-L-fucosidase
MDSLFDPDPLGEVTIAIPQEAIDPYATVVAIDLAPKTIEGAE